MLTVRKCMARTFTETELKSRVPPSVSPIPGANTAFGEYTGGCLVALLNLLLICLAEFVARWMDAGIGLSVHALTLLALLLIAAFDPSHKVRRLSLSLTLIPVIRIVGSSMPPGALPALERYVVVAAALSVAAIVVIRQLALRPEEIGLGFGEKPWWLAGYSLLFVLVAAILILRAPTSFLPAITVELVSLSVGFVEALIFYGIALRASRDLLGDRTSVIYLSLILAVLQLPVFSWPGGLITFMTSLLLGYLVMRKSTIYIAALAYGLTNTVLLLLLPPMNIRSPIDDSWGPVLFAVLLLALLAIKELAGTSAADERWPAFRRSLNMAIVPMTILFMIFAALRIVDALH